MIVLDACVLIAHLQPGQPQAARAREILDCDDDLSLHPLTLAECAVGPTKTGQSATFRHAVRRLGLDVWQPDPEHPYRVAALRATTALKLPDCCVLDAARAQAASLATFDHALAKTAAALGVPVIGP